MFVRVKKKSENKYAIQIVESVRDGDGKVKQKIIRHVGMAFNDDEVLAPEELARSIKIQIEESHQPSLFLVINYTWFESAMRNLTRFFSQDKLVKMKGYQPPKFVYFIRELLVKLSEHEWRCGTFLDVQ